EFVVNVASEPYARQVAGAAEPLPYGESEFGLVGLATAPSVKVRPPRVAESPVAFECRTLQVLRTNPGKPSGGNVVIGQVVHLHLAEGLVNDRLHVDADQLAAVARMGGSWYCRTHDRFQMPQGREALSLPPLQK